MDTYILSSIEEKLHGVGLRSKLKITAQNNDFELEAENLSDNRVMFKIKKETNIGPIIEFLMMFRPDTSIKKIS